MVGMGKVCGGDHNLGTSCELDQMYPNTLMCFLGELGFLVVKEN